MLFREINLQVKCNAAAYKRKMIKLKSDKNKQFGLDSLFFSLAPATSVSVRGIHPANKLMLNKG